MSVKFQNQKLYSSNLLLLGTKEKQIDIQQTVLKCQQNMINSKRTDRILKSTNQLHTLYPDIEDELCSRHSTLFGKLKQTFIKLYDDMQPTNYVVVKGSCQFVEQQLTEVGLSMGLENGIISLVTKTYQMSEIFVNSNHFSEETIFSHQGEIQQGIHVWTEEMQQVIKLATHNLPEQRLHGGIFYLHANIPEGEFNYKQSFLIALYLSVMVINQNLPNFTIDQMIDKLSKLKFVGTKEQIQRCFKGYKNRQFNLTLPDILNTRMGLQEIDLQEQENGGMMMKQLLEKQNKRNLLKNCHNNNQNFTEKSQICLSMSQQYKLVFCKLDLGKEDIEYELSRREELLERKRQLLKEMSHKYKINGLFELFHKLQTEIKVQNMHFQSIYKKISRPKSMEDIESQEQEEEILYHPNKFISKLLTQTKLVSQFSNNNINLQELINHVWEINSKDLKIHSSNVVQLVEDMKADLEINKSCMIINTNFLLIAVNKHNFTDLLCDIKHKMNKGELKSKSLFRIEDEDPIQQRWSSDKAIGEKIFSSVPAHGVGIFDPSDSIWFD